MNFAACILGSTGAYRVRPVRFTMCLVEAAFADLEAAAIQHTADFPRDEGAKCHGKAVAGLLEGA